MSLTNSHADPEPVAQTRLGIIHIMVWTVGVALMLAGYRALVDLSDQPPSHRSFWMVAQVISSMVNGASLGGLVLWAWRKFRGGSPFPVQPGHWCLVLCGVSTILGWIGYAVFEWAYPRGDETYEYQMARFRFYYAAHFPTYAALSILYLVAAWNCSRTHWILFFAVGAILTVFVAIAAGMVGIGIPELFFIGSWFYSAPEFVRVTAAIVSTLLMGVAVAGDWRASEKRDWLHWCGVTAGVVGCLSFLAWTVWRTLLFPS